MSDNSRSAIRAGVTDAFSKVLKRPVSADENVVRGEDPKWDSLVHVELVFLIEDSFDITLGEAQLERLTSLEAFVDCVAECRTAQA